MHVYINISSFEIFFQYFVRIFLFFCIWELSDINEETAVPMVLNVGINDEQEKCPLELL
jgi:hypothetical protein